MASLKTKFSVGLFLIIGITVIVVGIIWLGMSNYFEKGNLFVAYFDESVQGLDKDSPVKYRGVSIGRVQRIGVAPDERLIEVIMKIESEVQPHRDNHDIVAQLKSVGITGLMFIELERKKPGEGDLTPNIAFTPPYSVISTRPSEISKFFKGIEDIFASFRSIDIDTISQQLTEALQKINRTIDEAQIQALVADTREAINSMQHLLEQGHIQQMLTSVDVAAVDVRQMAVNADEGITEIRHTVSGLDSILDQGGDDIKAVTSDLRASSLKVRQAMESASDMLERTNRQMDALQRQALVTIGHIDQASRSLNHILDRLSNQPSQIIFGGPVPEKPTPPK
jgi:phospholipid/cholesterol/gamma-HCH transport system substrate-binding protein